MQSGVEVACHNHRSLPGQKYVHTHKHTHIHTHACIHTQVHTHPHTHINTKSKHGTVIEINVLFPQPCWYYTIWDGSLGLTDVFRKAEQPLQGLQTHRQKSATLI